MIPPSNGGTGSSAGEISQRHDEGLSRSFNISRELEDRLHSVVYSIVAQALSTLERSFRDEMKQMNDSIQALSLRVNQLENKLSSQYPAGSPLNESETHNTLSESSDHEPSPNKKNKNQHTEDSHQKKLIQLQSQVDSLTAQQMDMKREKEKEKRKCNILLGNVEESESESIQEIKEKIVSIFKDKLQVDLRPTHISRLGKPMTNKRRLVLVKLQCLDDKLRVLRGSEIYIMDDLSKNEREERKKLVDIMRKARSDGKRAFIRNSDGKLIIDGKIHTVSSGDHQISDSSNASPLQE